MVKYQVLCLVVAIVLLQRTHSSLSFDCREDCFGPFRAANESELTCELLVNARTCYNENRDNCSSTVINILNFQLSHHLNTRSCDIPTIATTSTTPTVATGTAFPCPSVTPQSRDLTVVDALIQPEGDVQDSCVLSGSVWDKQLQQCSLFLDGHLRPFQAYHNGLQTCSVPGSWKLFQHSDLVVEVEGQSTGHAHTSLTKVNVTLFAHGCNGMRSWSYVAESGVPLPTSFDGESSPYVNGDSALQLHIGSTGNVATVLATWINSTVVVRRVSGLLSITLYVTGMMSFNAEGLCSGCPRHQLLNPVSELTQFQTTCPPEQVNSVSFGCFLIQSLFGQRLSNISYFDACSYSSMKTTNEHTSVLLDGVGRDAKMLPNVGTVPARTRPTNPPLPSFHTATTIREDTSEVDPTTETDGRFTSTKSSVHVSTVSKETVSKETMGRIQFDIKFFSSASAVNSYGLVMYVIAVVLSSVVCS